MSHISSRTDVFHAISPTTGTVEQANVFHALQLFNLIKRQADAFAQLGHLITFKENASAVTSHHSGMKLSTTASLALKRLNTTPSKDSASVQPFTLSGKVTNVCPVTYQVIGIAIPNNVCTALPLMSTTLSTGCVCVLKTCISIKGNVLSVNYPIFGIAQKSNA